MQETPTPVSVSYTVGKRLFAAAGVSAEETPLEIGMQFNPFTPVQTPANNQLLASVSPELARKLSNVAGRLYHYQNDVMEFIRESKENAERFVENPLSVMVEVCRIPEDLRKEILELQKEWPRTAEEA